MLCGVAVVCMWWGMFNSFVYKYSAGFPIVSTRFVCVNLLSVTLFRVCVCVNISSAFFSDVVITLFGLGEHCVVHVRVAQV